MPRKRGESLVARIALDVPKMSPENPQERNESGINSGRPSQTSKKEYRSKSFDAEERPSKGWYQKEFMLFPFSEKESKELWSRVLESYNYDSLLSLEKVHFMENLAGDEVLNYQEICKVEEEYTQGLIKDTDAIQGLLESLTVQYNEITHAAEDFSSEANILLEKQTRNETVSEEIQNFLQIFESLDKVASTLSKPGIGIVKKKSFQELLEKLDKSLDFIKAHPSFRDIEMYEFRFRQCMTRSLTLIRNYLLEELKSIYDKVTRKLETETTNRAKNAALINYDVFIYNTFKSYLDDTEGLFYSQVNLVEQITKRIGDYQEYRSLLQDVLKQYFSVRSLLLKKPVSIFLKECGDSRETVIAQICQHGMSFFRRKLERELELFRDSFGYKSSYDVLAYMVSELYSWFKELLTPFYDFMRSKILRETNISSLCELAASLQKHYEFEEQNSLENYFQVKLSLGELFEPILHDTQSRLVYRIQTYVDGVLATYKPTIEDLNLGHRRNLTTGLVPLLQVETLDKDYSKNLFKELYVPVGKALTILTDVYELIDSIVFDDLAHYIIQDCIKMLKNNTYPKYVSAIGPFEAKLFYLNNLIIIYNQLSNFDIQNVREETTLDLTSGISEVIHDLRSGQYRHDNNGGFLDLLKKSVPKIVNNLIDAKYEVEVESDMLVLDLILECSNSIIKPLFESEPSSSPTEKCRLLRNNITTLLPQMVQKMNTYIKNDKVVQLLLDNLCHLFIQSYESFYIGLQQKLDTDVLLRRELQEIMEVETFLTFLTDFVASLDKSLDSTSANYSHENPLPSTNDPID